MLFSGGIDSSVAAAYLKSQNYEVIPLFVNHHQGPLNSERLAANTIAEILRIKKPYEVEVSLDKLKINKQWLRYGIGTPGRNLIFLSLAIMYAGIIDVNNVALASPYGSSYPDNSWAFLKQAEKVAQVVLDREISIFSPFKNEKWTSVDVVKQGNELGVPLEKTWSCCFDRSVHCGICAKCVNRKSRFEKARVKDKTKYDHSGIDEKKVKSALFYL